MYTHITSQAELDSEVEYLRHIGYPYIGQPEHNRLTLLPDGRIASEWTNDDDTEFLPDDDPQTQDAFWESVYCWYHDC